MLLRHEKRYSKNVSLESLVYKESDNNFTVEDTIAVDSSEDVQMTALSVAFSGLISVVN